MDVGRSLSFPFRDRAWPSRTLVGAGLEVLPLVLVVPLIRAILHFRDQPTRWLGPLVVAAVASLLARFVVFGYLRRLARSVLDGSDSSLPAWDRFGEDLIEGFRVWVLAFLLFTPAAGAVLAIAFLVAASGATGSAWLSVVLLAPPLALLTLFYLPAALLTAVATGEAARAFDFRRVTAHIHRAFPSYLVAIAVAVSAEIVAQLGLVALCVGIFATRFLAHCITVHAFASAHREGLPSSPLPPDLT